MKMAPDNIPSLETLTRKFQNLQVGVLVKGVVCLPPSIAGSDSYLSPVKHCCQVSAPLYPQPAPQLP